MKLGWLALWLAGAFSAAEFDEYVKAILRPTGGLEGVPVLKPEELPHDLHVVITDTSTYFHNYRHVTNALIMYRIVKWLGVPDSKIHLFIGECSACDPRNIEHGRIYYEPARWHDIYESPGQLEIDYQGANVHSNAWMTLMSGRQRSYSPVSQILQSDEHSNLFVYINGHGGNQFTKFQDFDELSADLIGEALLELKIKHKYRELFFLVDSCQALTLGDEIFAPNTAVLGSSQIGENAYSCNDDQHIGLSLMDRFTYKTALLFQSLKVTEAWNLSVDDYIRSMDFKYLMAPPGTRSDRLGRSLRETLLLSFLADPAVFNALEKEPHKRGRAKKIDKGGSPIELACKFENI